MSAPVFNKTAIALAAALLCQLSAHAQLPSGGTVVGGAATINQAGQNQVINQTTNKAIINWQDFSIGAGNSVRVNQPNSSSVLLNRVVGGNPSTILGSLSANGQVFLINPFGVYFGASATVDVGGLLASTLSISNADFMSGNYVFSREGLAARREVINAGVLKAREGGYIVLAGDYAANRGVIEARMGTAALASGGKLTLDVAGDSLINFTVDAKTVADLSGVDNSGQLLADGGRAIMTAAVARELTTASVNNSGLVRAQTMVERDGEIYLSADGGNTQVSGTLDASGKGAGQSGGRIAVLGDRVALTGSARIDASGDAGGGAVNIGGSFQGKGPLPNARTAYVGQDVRINADAVTRGKGGDVVVWSDDYTRYYGSISAQGGAQSGDGGNVEVSGKAVLDYQGSVSTRAAQGKAGTLLLDPSDIEILKTIDPATADMTGSTPFSDASDNGSTSRMTVGALESALAGGNVTVTTKTTSGTAPKGGTITLDDGDSNGLQWSSGNTLTLMADNRIQINSDIGASNATLVMQAANGATLKRGATINVNSLLLSGGGDWKLAGTDSGTGIGSYNNVNNIAANLNGGLLEFANNKTLAIGSVNGVNGINNSGGLTWFYLDRNNGSLQLQQNVNSSIVYLRATGGVNQTGGSINADSLVLVGGGATLNQAGNNVNNLMASINGALSYRDADRLTIGSLYGINGISTNNNNVTITTGDSASYDGKNLPTKGNASLVLNERVDAGTGTVRLTAGNGGVFQRNDLDPATGDPNPAGSIKANNLVLRGSSSTAVTPFILNNSSNEVKTLAATANGSISYTGAFLTIGSLDGINGITATANTIVTPAGKDASGRDTPAIYNDNNVTLSIGGDLNINQSINASTSTGTGLVSIGIGGDYTAKTNNGSRINANSLGVYGEDMQGKFDLVTNVKTISAGGGQSMAIDNSAFTGTLTALGIGASAGSATLPDQATLPEGVTLPKDGAGSGGNGTVNASERPVGDFYLTTGGDLNIIKLNSQGDNLLLRSSKLDIVLDAATKDGARIMLQPINKSAKIGINNSNDSDFVPNVNYSGTLLKKFTNQSATFFFGTAQDVIRNDKNVHASAKTVFSGDIHIGSNGPLDLGYRSLSAQTTGSIVAHDIGPLYNLRLAATNLTIYSFKTFGPQMHFFTNNLYLPGTVASYQNPNKPTITFRSLNDQTMWVGNNYNGSSRPEYGFRSQDLVKMPDGSTIVISGSTDYPFPNGGAGYGDIHITWDDVYPRAQLGNRRLILSTTKDVVVRSGYSPPKYQVKNDGGTSGGLWLGCQDLATCKGDNPNPYVGSEGGGSAPGGGGSGNGGDGSTTPDSGNSGGGNPVNPDPTNNPYPPVTGDTGSGGTGDGGSGIGGGDSGSPGDGGGDGGGGTGTGGGGTGIGDPGNGTDGGGDGGTGNGTGGGGTGDGTGGSGTGGAGDGTGGADGGNGSGAGSGIGGGGTGDGDGGTGTAGGGAGDGNGGTGTGGGGAGDGSGGGTGDGDGGAGTGTGGAGDGNAAGTGGTGDGDGGAGAGTGGAGDGTGDAGNGTGGTGTGDAGDGNGDGGAGIGGGDLGDGTGSGDKSGSGTGTGDGGSGTKGGGTGDGAGGAGTGGAGAGDGSDAGGNGGDGGNTGDAGSATKSGGTADDKSASDGAGTGDGASAVAPAAFDLSCADVSAAPVQETKDDDNADAKKRLVQISREGVRMNDPCQKQPEQGGQAEPNRR